MRSALSLLELMIATVVMAVCLVPLSRGLSAQASAAKRAGNMNEGYAAVLSSRSAQLNDFYQRKDFDGCARLSDGVSCAPYEGNTTVAGGKARAWLWQVGSTDDAGSMRLFVAGDKA